MSRRTSVSTEARAVVSRGSIWLWPTTSRMTLSATALMVASGWRITNRYCSAFAMRQNTAKLISTMFWSPVSIRLSAGTSWGGGGAAPGWTEGER